MATEPDLGAIREAHAKQERILDPYPTCSACTRCACYLPVEWPCDVAVALQVVDAQAARLPADRRCHYGVDCGHTWAWSRGEACPECRLQAAYDALVAERDQAAPVLAACEQWEQAQQYWHALERVLAPSDKVRDAIRACREIEGRVMDAVAVWRAGKLA